MTQKPTSKRYWQKRDVILLLGCAAFVYGLILASPWMLLVLAGVLLIGLWWVVAP